MASHSEQICLTSWTNLLNVFDFYLSVGIKPIFEISGMPSFLAWNQQSPSHVMWYRFGNMMPGNDTAWGDFIQVRVLRVRDSPHTQPQTL